MSQSVAMTHLSSCPHGSFMNIIILSKMYEIAIYCKNLATQKFSGIQMYSQYRMSQFVGGNLCWRFLRKFTFGGLYFGDFLHLQELGVARVNNQLLLADFILAIYLSTANPPTLIPRQQIDSYGINCCD